MHSQNGLGGGSNGTAAGAGSGSAGDAELVPCVSAALRDAGLCVQMMQRTNDMHLNIFAADTEWLDVRVGSSSGGCSARQDSSPEDSEELPEAGEQGTPTGSQHGSGGRLDAAALGRVVRWASCGEDLLSRRSGSQRSPFAGFSVDAEVPAAAGLLRVSTAANSASTLLQRQTIAGVPSHSMLLGDAHSNAPAALTLAVDMLLDDSPDSPAGAVAAEPATAAAAAGFGSKAASGDGRSDPEAGDQQLGSFDLFPPLLQPAPNHSQGPQLAIIKILDELPADESAHLACKGRRAGCRAAAEASRGVSGAAVTGGSGAEAAFKLYFGFLSEGTMSVEVGLSQPASPTQQDPRLWFLSSCEQAATLLVSCCIRQSWALGGVVQCSLQPLMDSSRK
jgi:hypothetical protein